MTDIPAEAAGLLASAEAEPCFRWRLEPARAALDRAAALLPIEGRADLDARAALRRAVIELAAEEPEAARSFADLATVAARRALDPLRALMARVISARAALRVPELAEAGTIELDAIAEELEVAEDAAPPGELDVGIELGALLAIAFAERHLGALELEAAREAYDDAEDLLRGAGAKALPDTRFLALQGTALVAQLTRSFGRAADRLRTLVRLVHGHVSPRDELEARMALGHMLSQLGKHADAVRHMDLARKLAKDSGTVDELFLATQSAALAALHAGSYGRALDRAYEALQLAGLEKRDLFSYVSVVSLIAQINLVRGSDAEAYLALLYASASVKQRIGPQATVMLEAQIEELKARMGPEKFERMCQEILRARAERAKLEPE
jgi:hypothetical protein